MSRTTPTTGQASLNSNNYDTNTIGTLGKPVHLGFSDGPNVDEDNVKTLTEKIKGNFKTLRDLNLAEFKVGNERPTSLFTSGAIATCFAAPAADLTGKKKWYITSSVVEEEEAGDHAIMTITYTARKDKNSSDSEDEAEEITDTWQLETQELDVSIYSYCTDTDSVSNNNAKWIKMWEEESNTKLVSEHKFTNLEDGEVYCLTEAGIAIAKLISRGITTIKSYVPVIVHTTIYTNGSLAEKKIAEDVSTIDTPNYTPWETLISKYHWLKISDNVNAEFSGNNVVKQVRTEKWIGSKTELLSQFYSKKPSERWKMPMASAIEYESSSSTETSTESE